MKFVIITGLSGAGKTTALKSLENMGYFCVDNLPCALLSKFAELCKNGEFDKVAVCIDARGKKFFSEFDIDAIGKIGLLPDILFLTSNTETLVNRYNFTRQAHPLKDEYATLGECVEKENEILKPIKERATFLLDTSLLTAKDIKTSLERIFGESENVKVNIFSFGFKRGIPVDADFVFDVRFLPNPYNDLSLRPHSGKEEEVISFLKKSPDFDKTVKMLKSEIEYILPLYLQSGKQELTFAVGCTGGFHRSVAVAEALASALSQNGISVDCTHRDIDK